MADADGFFLNVSNYQFTVNSEDYGRWISDCLAYATARLAGQPLLCKGAEFTKTDLALA